MSNSIKPVDHGMLTKIGEKVGGTKDPLSASGVNRVDERKSAGKASAGETVELTSGARLLERLEKTLAAMPDIDAGRVDAVKTAIANGDYVIDAEKIADALIRSDRELGN
jgi:negative regulator of flagellin synthesis FlgM